MYPQTLHLHAPPFPIILSLPFRNTIESREEPLAAISLGGGNGSTELMLGRMAEFGNARADETIPISYSRQIGSAGRTNKAGTLASTFRSRACRTSR